MYATRSDQCGWLSCAIEEEEDVVVVVAAAAAAAVVVVAAVFVVVVKITCERKGPTRKMNETKTN